MTSIVGHKKYLAYISPLCALIAVGFSIFFYIRTNLILKPFARPIFGPIEQTYIDSLKKISYKFKNIGNHPAYDIRFFCCYSPIDKPELIKIADNFNIANSVEQNNVINWTISINYEKDAMVYFAIEYSDLLDMDKRYLNEFWLIFQKDLNIFVNASMDGKRLLLPYILNIFPERKKYFKDEVTQQLIPSSSQMNDLLRKFRLNKR